MADSGSQGMQQQALRRQYEPSSISYTHQQHFYPTYSIHYPTYPNHMGAPQYHQPLPVHQWGYFNANLYMRSQHSYQNYGHYAYPHPNAYHSRAIVQQPYPVQVRSQHEISAPVIAPRPQEPPMQVPPTPPLDTRISRSPVPTVTTSGHRAPYYPPLPWLSIPEKPFPPRQLKSKRRPRAQSSSRPVELPVRKIDLALVQKKSTPDIPSISRRDDESSRYKTERAEETFGEITEADPNTGEPKSHNLASPGKTTSPTTQRPNVIVPIIPKFSATAKSMVEDLSRVGVNVSDIDVKTQDETAIQPAREHNQDRNQPENLKPQAKSWAELLRAPIGTSATAGEPDGAQTASQPSLHQPRQDLLGRSILSYSFDRPYKLHFLEPRGLVNSGNMCYMNSILQALAFCVPLYNFLLHVSKHAVYSFKSNTPLLDAMIMFIKEFNVIDSADSAEKLRLRLKPLELEQFGEPLLPEYVYEEIRRMPRFATMQRGHQQDAEEFLGFLFEELQRECARAVHSYSITNVQDKSTSEQNNETKEDDGWLEVGPRQKASTTRSSGSIDADTPINRIFGGQLRSELRIPGAKNSITMEPYQSLQLDIGSPEIKNIVDALKGLTKPETLHGDFHSPRGVGATATKQVFIEALPQVLILHLKRFQYDNTGGTQKVWKNIGYPLQLEIPKEVFPHSKRGSFTVRGGLPKYRLISVIYHHGKSATTGHYTTDLLRQDSREWLRIDDTMIQRVRSQEVEAGGEDTYRAIATALEGHRTELSEIFQAAENLSSEGLDGDSEKGWSQARNSGKRWSGIVDGTTRSSGIDTPIGSQSLKDNKVAYILFYQKDNF